MENILVDDTTKAIRVDVKESGVSQKVELCGEVPDDIGVIKFDANDNANRGVAKHHGAEDIVIVAHVRVNVIAKEVIGVEIRSLLPCPQSNVSVMEGGLAMEMLISTSTLKSSKRSPFFERKRSKALERTKERHKREEKQNMIVKPEGRIKLKNDSKVFT